MPGRTAIVIAIDGLRASALGAYGNTWYGTPSFDALAAESLVADWMWCDSPDVAGFYQACWRRGASWRDRVIQAAGCATLITDDVTIAQADAGFNEALVVDCSRRDSARRVDETAAAELFAAAADHLAARERAADDAPQLLWIHSQGLYGAWDAPISLRAGLLEEGDPPAPTYVAPPENLATFDHDELLIHRAAYAAQIIAMDECLGGLLSAVEQMAAGREVMLIVVGCRGFALGEHGAIGRNARRLYGELLHVPYLVRTPDGRFPLPRCGRLVHPSDLAVRLAQWFGASDAMGEVDASSLDAGDGGAPERIIVSVGDAGERGLRTRDWFLTATPVADDAGAPLSPKVELYVKPDDRWEANEVADRCPEDAARLLALLAVLPQGPSAAPATSASTARLAVH